MNKLLQGTLLLTIAGLVSKILGSFFRIPLQNAAGDEVFGIFSMVYPVYMVILTIAVAGIPLAISMQIAEALNQNDRLKVSQTITVASHTGLWLGVASFLLVVIVSEPLSYALGGVETQFALIMVSATLVVAPYMAVFRGVHQGFDLMKPTAVSQILEQFIRVAIILFLAYSLAQTEMKADEVTGWVFSSSILGVLAALVYLKLQFKKKQTFFKLPSVDMTFGEKNRLSIKLLKNSFPITIGTLAITAFAMVDSFAIPLSISSTEKQSLFSDFGIFSRGVVLMQLFTVVASSLVLPLLPKLVKEIAEGGGNVAHLVDKALGYNLVAVAGPVMVALVLASSLNFALFQDTLGTHALVIHLISATFVSFVTVFIGLLQGVGDSATAAKWVAVAVFIKLILSIGFVSQVGLTGAAYASLISYGFLYSILAWVISKRWKIPILPSSWRTIVFYAVGATVGTAVCVYLGGIVGWQNGSRVDAWLLLLSAGGGGMLCYSPVLRKWK